MSSYSVFKQNQLLYIQTWKKHVSQKQLIKFIPRTNTKLYKEISLHENGEYCLQIMKQLKKAFVERDNYCFFEYVNKMYIFMKEYTTIEKLFPEQIKKNIYILKDFSGCNKSKNTIYLTTKHRLHCGLCGEAVVGNQSKKKTCLCSTLFFHETCYNSYSQKCKICGYIYGL